MVKGGVISRMGQAGVVIKRVQSRVGVIRSGHVLRVIRGSMQSRRRGHKREWSRGWSHLEE